MNKQKGIRINKVRCYADSVKNPLKIRQQRDVSKKEYKQQFNVMNDSNYLMAIYEGEEKGRKKFAVEVINMLGCCQVLQEECRQRCLFLHRSHRQERLPFESLSASGLACPFVRRIG